MTDPPIRRATLLDVAQRAGVSRTTASFVTTGRTDMRISVDAQERVLRAARELNYRPSLLARSLRTNRSQTIGMLSDGIASDAFAGELVRGSLTCALLHDHLLFVAETTGDVGLEKRLIHNMIDRGVGGFLRASMYTQRVRVSAALRAHPLVLVNCTTRSRAVSSVAPDERGAGRSVARELLRHGHGDRIVLVGETPSHVVAAVERLAGIEDVLRAQGLQLAATIPTMWWPEQAMAAVSSYLAQGTRPTAFLCLNDRIAMGTYQACEEAGLAVPEDISVISFDDSDLASWLRPQLSSVAIPHFEMGRRAVEILLAGDPPQSHLVPMTLRERHSVDRPAARRRRSPAKRSTQPSAGSGAALSTSPEPDRMP
jgi:LacI family transcriptional regulator